MDQESYLFCRTLWGAAQAGDEAQVVHILAAAKTGAYGDKVRAPTRFPEWRRGVNAAMRVAAWNDFVELVPVFRDALASAGYGLEDAWKEPLWLAAHTGSDAFVSALLQLKASPDATASQETTLLEAAVDCGHVSTATVLLEAGADVNLVRPAAGTAPLHRAVCTDNAELIQVLLQFKARVNLRMAVPVRQWTWEDVRGMFAGATPLFFAARDSGDIVRTVQLLLAHKADVDLACANGSTPIKAAAARGNAAVLRALVRAKADLDTAAHKNVTPVYAAALNGMHAAVQILAAAKANINPQSTGMTPLCATVRDYHRLPTTLVLVSAKADVDMGWQNTGETPLYIATVCANRQAVRLLLDARAQVDRPCISGKTPLWAARDHRSIRIFQDLVAAKACVNVRWESGTTPLHHAVSQSAVDVVALLLQANADVDAAYSVDGNLGVRTPVYVATEKCCAKTLQLLLAVKADADKGVASDGSTSLWRAAMYGHVHSVLMLLGAKADVNRKPARGPLAGVPPLYAAARAGNYNTVRLLLGAHAVPDAALALDGTSPLWTASARGYTDVVRLLLDAKANADLSPTQGHLAHMTPLIVAVGGGHRTVAQLLVEAKGDSHGRAVQTSSRAEVDVYSVPSPPSLDEASNTNGVPRRKRVRPASRVDRRATSVDESASEETGGAGALRGGASALNGAPGAGIDDAHGADE